MANKAASEKESLVHELANAQNKLDGEINALQGQREAEKQKLIDQLSTGTHTHTHMHTYRCVLILWNTQSVLYLW